MNLEEFDFEKDIKKKKKKKTKKATGHYGLIAFLLLLLGLLSGAMTMILILYFSHLKVNHAQEGPIITVEKSDESKEEVILKEDEEIAVEQDEDIDAKRLEDIKNTLQNGDGVIAALRKGYPDDLVVVRGKQYNFVPIIKTLKMNNYSIDNISTENGYEYTFEDGTKARKGIDVSKYQGEIDWEAVASDGIEFAIIRAGIRGYGSGKLVMDDDFALHITEAINAGLDAGVYFFSQAITEEEAIEEADAVIGALNGNGLNYPMVIDVEHVNGGRQSEISVDKRTDVVIAFCDRVREAGYTPMIYGNLDTFTLQLDMTRIENVEKWLADYDLDLYFPYEYSMWQYTSKGRISGISEPVDINLDLRR